MIAGIASAPYLAAPPLPAPAQAAGGAEPLRAAAAAAPAQPTGGTTLVSAATVVSAQSQHGAGCGCEGCGAASLTSGKDSVQAGQLSEDEQAKVDSLKERDREVRAHEAAHASAGGAHAGAPSYEYEVGPDGQRYAVGGEVSIDVAPVNGDPQATIAKMEQVIRAALAPAEPSGQDRAVAAQAQAQMRQAQADATQKTTDEQADALAQDKGENGALPKAAVGLDEAINGPSLSLIV